MPFTRQDAYNTLASLQPAPVFLWAYEAKRLPEDVDLYFRPPEEFFIAPDSQRLYTQGVWVPVLDNGSFSIVTFCDPATRRLMQMDVERPGEVLSTFDHWNHYLADLMTRVAESADDDERLARIARLTGAVIAPPRNGTTT